MTYLRQGHEYLDADERKVYEAIVRLNRARRTTNNSQIARIVHLSPTTVGKVARELSGRRYIRNVSKGAAYHWRATDKPVLYYHDHFTTVDGRAEPKHESFGLVDHRYRAAAELAAEFGNDIEEWLV